jgi:hypothetical protein
MTLSGICRHFWDERAPSGPVQLNRGATSEGSIVDDLCVQTVFSSAIHYFSDFLNHEYGTFLILMRFVATAIH